MPASSDGHDDQRKVLDVRFELMVHAGETDRSEELAELIELGRLQRDGITGFDLHRPVILADGRGFGPVDFRTRRRAPGPDRATVAPETGASGAGPPIRNGCRPPDRSTT